MPAEKVDSSRVSQREEERVENSRDRHRRAGHSQSCGQADLSQLQLGDVLRNNRSEHVPGGQEPRAPMLSLPATSSEVQHTGFLHRTAENGTWHRQRQRKGKRQRQGQTPLTKFPPQQRQAGTCRGGRRGDHGFVISPGVDSRASDFNELGESRPRRCMQEATPTCGSSCSAYESYLSDLAAAGSDLITAFAIYIYCTRVRYETTQLHTSTSYFSPTYQSTRWTCCRSRRRIWRTI